MCVFASYFYNGLLSSLQLCNIINCATVEGRALLLMYCINNVILFNYLTWIQSIIKYVTLWLQNHVAYAQWPFPSICMLLVLHLNNSPLTAKKWTPWQQWTDNLYIQDKAKYFFTETVAHHPLIFFFFLGSFAWNGYSSISMWSPEIFNLQRSHRRCLTCWSYAKF